MQDSISLRVESLLTPLKFQVCKTINHAICARSVILFFFFPVGLLYHVQVVTSKNTSPKIHVKPDYSFSWSKQQVKMNPCCSRSYLLALEFFSLDLQPSCCNTVFRREAHSSSHLFHTISPDEMASSLPGRKEFNSGARSQTSTIWPEGRENKSKGWTTSFCSSKSYIGSAVLSNQVF